MGKGIQVMTYAAVNMCLHLREEILYNVAVTIEIQYLPQNILFMVNVIVKSITDKVIIIKTNWRKVFLS